MRAVIPKSTQGIDFAMTVSMMNWYCSVQACLKLQFVNSRSVCLLGLSVMA